jgi:hypothetical protein
MTPLPGTDLGHRTYCVSKDAGIVHPLSPNDSPAEPICSTDFSERNIGPRPFLSQERKLAVLGSDQDLPDLPGPPQTAGDLPGRATGTQEPGNFRGAAFARG